MQCSSKNNFCLLNNWGGKAEVHKKNHQRFCNIPILPHIITTIIGAKSLGHQTQRVRTSLLAKQGSKRNPNCGNWHKEFGLSTYITKWFYVTVAAGMGGVTTAIVTERQDSKQQLLPVLLFENTNTKAGVPAQTPQKTGFTVNSAYLKSWIEFQQDAVLLFIYNPHTSLHAVTTAAPFQHSKWCLSFACNILSYKTHMMKSKLRFN